jgi:hypothetical protein
MFLHFRAPRWSLRARCTGEVSDVGPQTVAHGRARFVRTAVELLADIVARSGLAALGNLEGPGSAAVKFPLVHPQVGRLAVCLQVHQEDEPMMGTLAQRASLQGLARVAFEYEHVVRPAKLSRRDAPEVVGGVPQPIEGPVVHLAQIFHGNAARSRTFNCISSCSPPRRRRRGSNNLIPIRAPLEMRRPRRVQMHFVMQSTAARAPRLQPA